MTRLKGHCLGFKLHRQILTRNETFCVVVVRSKLEAFQATTYLSTRVPGRAALCHGQSRR